MRQLPSQTYISHHLGRDFLKWTKKSHSEDQGLLSSFLCSYLDQNMQTHTLAAQSLKVTT
jgi:hypothetical protein